MRSVTIQKHSLAAPACSDLQPQESKLTCVLLVSGQIGGRGRRSREPMAAARRALTTLASCQTRRRDRVLVHPAAPPMNPAAIPVPAKFPRAPRASQTVPSHLFRKPRVFEARTRHNLIRSTSCNLRMTIARVSSMTRSPGRRRLRPPCHDLLTPSTTS